VNFDAIELVTRTLRDALNQAFKAQEIAGGVYVGPLDDPDAQDAAVVLFLYRVMANADLRGAEHRVPAADSTQPPVVYRGALPLDLYYLLTGGDRQTGGELQSLRALGCAMQTLNDHPQIVGVGVGGDTVRVTLEPIGGDEMSRIWTLFPNANFRTSVGYLASPVWIDPAIVREEGPPVVREPHRAGQFEQGAP
jgi:hypothetical protein